MPILLSLEQMRNLYMKFEHTPQVDYLTCAAFGMKNFPVPISTTNHLIIDLAELKYSPQIVECTWLNENVQMMRSAKEVNTSVTDFLEKNMQFQATGEDTQELSLIHISEPTRPY